MEPIPATIGRYVVESLVGAGGMGQIYKAHDPDIRRTVAIKLISTRLMSSADRSEYMRRFRREAEAAARCAHPNIVAIYDYALHEGQPFLAMEFVHGRSVRQIIDEQPMVVRDAVQVMLQVLEALASAHEQGVIHQDIKPANIMLTLQGHAKVADFGISRFANTDVTSISSSMGTPNYMAPEQCRGGPVDHRADLFAAGATLFEMVAGERAFGGRNSAEVTHRIMNERLPLLPAAVRSEAPRLQFVLERAMGKQSEDRFELGPRDGRGAAAGPGHPGGRRVGEQAVGRCGGGDGHHAACSAGRTARSAAGSANGRTTDRSLADRGQHTARTGAEACGLPGADRAHHGPLRRRARAVPGCVVRDACRVRARRQRARQLPPRRRPAPADASAGGGRRALARQHRFPARSGAGTGNAGADAVCRPDRPCPGAAGRP